MTLTADGVRLRRAGAGDLAFLAELVTHEEVEPFLAAARPKGWEALREEIERSEREPLEFGSFLVETREGEEWRPAGAVNFEVVNRRSRIAQLGGLALRPEARGRGVATLAARLLQRHLLFDLDLHRLQLECYGFNSAAIQHAERAGFVREGVRRMAYWRHGEWVDGVLFGLVREDLDAHEADAGSSSAS